VRLTDAPKETAMYTQWIEDCVVQRVSVRDGLVLDLDDYNEIVISRPLILTLPAVDRFPVEAVLIDPLRISVYERPLLNLAGAVCTQAWSDDEGGLHLSFSRGHRIDVDPDAEETAWELYGKRHGYMACLPRGRVRVVRHDVPEDDNANIVNPR
jgi:hypothetical protein